MCITLEFLLTVLVCIVYFLCLILSYDIHLNYFIGFIVWLNIEKRISLAH